MTGNVAEWVADWWDFDYYASSPYANPTDPENGVYKAYRGGSFDTPESILDLYRRRMQFSEYHVQDWGFRCVLPVGQ